MKQVWAQAIKELKQLWRDRLTLTLAGLLPIMLLMLFGKALSLNIKNIPIYLMDEDMTPLSRQYVETYAASNKFVFIPLPAGQSRTAPLESGLAKAGLFIPAGFQREFQRGAPVAVQMLIDGSDSNTGTLLRNFAKALHEAFLQRVLTAPVPSARLAVRFWYNPGLSNDRYFGTGAFALVLILFPALLAALAVSREHEQGTIIQVYASSLTATQWLLGKGLPVIFVGAVQWLLCFITGYFFFGYEILGDPGPLLAGSVLYLTAGTFYGMMVGNLTGTQSAAIQGVQLGAFLVSMLLSGFIFPVANMPVVLQYVSLLLPARHFLEIARDTFLRGGGWRANGIPVVALAALGLVFFRANLGKLKRMQFPD